MTELPKGQLLVISGPSAGVGKDTILGLFKQAHPDWQSPPSATTRLPRQGEVRNRDMIFLNRGEFERRIKADEFFEYFEVDGNLYGTLREPVMTLLAKNHNVVLRKDVKGAIAIKKLLPDSVIVMLVPESWGMLEKRLRGRATDNEETIQRRLALAKKELAYQDGFDYIITNPEGHPEEALYHIETAVGFTH